MSEKIMNQKAQVVQEIKEKIEKSRAVILIDYKGLTVEDDTKLRQTLREKGIDYKVLKNTMVRRAFNELGVTSLDEVLNGPTAVAFGYEDEAVVAKAISEIASGNKKAFEIKSAYVDGAALDAATISGLAKVGSRAGVYSQLMGTLLAPVQKLAGTLQAVAEKG